MTAAATDTIPPLPVASPQFVWSPDRLRRLRLAAGFSSTEFAVRIGRSPFSLAGYERRQPPPADVLARMAAVLGLHPGDLFAPVEEATT
jgi:transcriptional regulator with XRE-family HTH domain